MIEMKEINLAEVDQLVELRALCWPEELNGQSGQVLDVEEDLLFWIDWLQSAAEHNDVRLMIGLFDNGQLLGAAIGSLAEETDIPNKGMELNGLWVYTEYRGRGLSLLLMKTVLCFFERLGMQEVVIYNFHHSPSNTFYRQLGCRVMRQDMQMEEKVPVDVFAIALSPFLQTIESRLVKYPLQVEVLPFTRAARSACLYTRRLSL